MLKQILFLFTSQVFRKTSYILIFQSIFISNGCRNSSHTSESIDHPTFTEHISPIIYQNCTPCHRPGSGAPFNLITYSDVKRHARTIELTVVSRSMPPWPADPTYSHFRGEKYLSENDIELISRWIEDDTPEGDPILLKSPPQFPVTGIVGNPDLTLRIKNPFKLPGDNKDKFMMMKIPYLLPRDTFIRAIEIIPGNKKLVHHINAHLIQYQPSAKKNNSEGVDFVNTELMNKAQAYVELGLPNDDGTYPLLTPSVTNYLPGVEVSIYPKGIGGYKVKKQGTLLLDNIHYGPTPVDTTDQTSFNFFFSPVPPTRPTVELILGTSGISKVEPILVVEPNQVQTFRTKYTVPEDLSILTINPHMHLLGKSFLAYALLPSGDTVRLIRIPIWDFRWQYFYTFKKIIKIPAGSVIVAEGVYDNTKNNPLNPFDPPRVIAEREGSMRTTDEMFQLIITCLPYLPGDENISLENP